MVDSVWSRLAPYLGGEDAKPAAVARQLDVSFQAADKLIKGGGLSLENHLRVCKQHGINPWWLASGHGPERLDQLCSTAALPLTPRNPSVAHITERLAEKLTTLDSTDRKLAAAILHDLALTPDQGLAMAQKMQRLLGEPEAAAMELALKQSNQ